MSNEITLSDKLARLPVKTQTLMKGWRESPRKSYDSLPDVISHEEILKSDSPSLSQIKNCISEDQAIAIISMAIDNVNYLFRKDRRMDEYEVVITAKAILRRYWYLKPEDIKKCFNGSRPKSFVLEGDSFLSWLAEYDLKRDNTCEDMACNGREADRQADSISHTAYMAMLEARANDGDEKAVNILNDYKKRSKVLSPDQQRKEDLEFFKFRQKYVENRKKIHSP